ncbi:pilus assembly protein [Lampropedia aestuarii]|uniref:Pilus assembly protein n=1 Tax=Lampropedia aestuarii TaxID=2562762 RepID=A0A4S5BU89_9BURK|nr:TadE family protein [Lampropedia aestuarii]THJ34575.1 pilus assembly protein [Lampropedia aestuarii]
MTRTTVGPRQSTPHAQQGLAAIEFALIATVMLVMLMGLFVFWRAFQAQQSLTRAVGDGARMAHSLIAAGKYYPCGVTEAPTNQQYILSAIQSLVQTSLELSDMPGQVSSNLHFDPPSWSCSTGQFSFQVRYTLPPLMGEGTLEFEPAQLTEKSVVHFAPLI